MPTPSLRTDGLLVAPLVVGICGTDLQILRNHRSDTAAILGHEGMATVLAAGIDGCGFQAGDTVIFNPVNPRNQAEILGHSCDGLMQERRWVSASELAWGLVVQAEVSDLDPLLGALVEPLAAVLYGFELVGQAVAMQTVAVIGAGPAGLLAVLSAQDLGAAQVLLITNSQRRRQWVANRGILPARFVLVAGEENLAAAVSQRLAGRKLDAAFLCTPRTAATSMLESILPALRQGGCTDLLGGFADGDCITALPGLDLNSVRRANVCGIPQPGIVAERVCADGKRIHVTGHRGTALRHLALAQTVLSQAADRYGCVITHRCSLNAAPEMLAQLLGRTRARAFDQAEFVKGVIDFRLAGHVVETANADWKYQEQREVNNEP
ncbi:MAG TPA: alcohol dehydrogenase catalytic domain-containing protein [Ideonella sp.]|uniref:alcohol dehydrogenase catalytic domain-containing protein n=1 Tax=Ideonella sp. TaxID=1929293 RepID=UPI002E2ED6BC|nr:alcohol dehydrogenase catalytic domain-containing protein [Ideonella sp.]HEX5684348.1 alcohol dehydrogenase catalytic domain-containing protein [Ideonella sp.]